MTNKSEEKIDRVLRVEPKVGEENITIRLSGAWLSRWRTVMECAGDSSKSDVMREALSLYFSANSLDDSGEPVRVILRRKDASGNDMPDVDLIDYLNLPTVQAYRASRQLNNRKRPST